MGRKCSYDDSNLKKAISLPGDFPYKKQILRIFERYGYYNEGIAYKVSKIRKWDNDWQLIRYRRIGELADSIVVLKGGNSLNGVIAESAREHLAELALMSLRSELGKWGTHNFQALYAYLVDKGAIQNDELFLIDENGRVYVISKGEKRRATKEEYDRYIERINPYNPQSTQAADKVFSEDEWLYLMDHFICNLFDTTFFNYSSIDTDLFRQIVEYVYDYIIQNQESIRSDSDLWLGLIDFTVCRMIDSDLLSRLENLLQEPLSNIALEERQRKKIKRMIDGSFTALRIPDILHEYQYWEVMSGNFLSETKTADGEYVFRKKLELSFLKMNGENCFSNTQVARYLYFALTEEPVMRRNGSGGLPTTIACIIDDVMVLFGYRESTDDEIKARVSIQTSRVNNGLPSDLPITSSRIETRVKKMKRDRVKSYFDTDPETGEYIK